MPKPVLGFLVSANGRLVATATSLAQAKRAAEPYTAEAVQLTIQSYSGPAWRRVWLYDRATKEWIEQKATLTGRGVAAVTSGKTPAIGVKRKRYRRLLVLA
jgi:hypothetical protein